MNYLMLLCPLGLIVLLYYSESEFIFGSSNLRSNIRTRHDVALTYSSRQKLYTRRLNNHDVNYVLCEQHVNEFVCNSQPNCIWTLDSRKPSAFNMRCVHESDKESSSPWMFQRYTGPVADLYRKYSKERHYSPVSKQSIKRQIESNLSLTCSNTLVDSLHDDPCYDYNSGSQALISECGCGRKSLMHYNKITYLIPSLKSDRKPLTQSELKTETVFAFIHVNKAAGTTVKHALFDTLAENRWDGAPYGTFRGWKNLGPPVLYRNKSAQFKINAKRSKRNSFVPETRNFDSTVMSLDRIKRLRKAKTNNIVPREPLYVSCGDWVVNMDAKYGIKKFQKANDCPIRAVWGGLSMGLCDHFPDRPCVYFMVLRDPIKRAISDYNYFCTEGAEDRKKWSSHWHQVGECKSNIIEYYQQRITSPHFLVERLTRGCDMDCGTEAAIANLKHPCLRFLILEDLNFGLEKLADLYGGPMGDAFRRMIALKQHKNQ